MLDFTDPSQSGRSAGRVRPYTDSSASASMGSPRRVPVPWASTTSMSAALSRAAASACLITRCCAGPFGAVKPVDAPSEFTALPRTTASTRCLLRCASDNRSSTSTPTPSLQPAPSADAANALDLPSGDRARWRERAMNIPVVHITVTPPASARSHSPLRSDCAATCNATSEDEQAVSTVSAGPSRPSAYDTRPDSTLTELPVPGYPSTCSTGSGMSLA